MDQLTFCLQKFNSKNVSGETVLMTLVIFLVILFAEYEIRNLHLIHQVNMNIEKTMICNVYHFRPIEYIRLSTSKGYAVLQIHQIFQILPSQLQADCQPSFKPKA